MQSKMTIVLLGLLASSASLSMQASAAGNAVANGSSFQELQSRIEQTQARVTSLSAENEELRAEVDAKFAVLEANSPVGDNSPPVIELLSSEQDQSSGWSTFNFRVSDNEELGETIVFSDNLDIALGSDDFIYTSYPRTLFARANVNEGYFTAKSRASVGAENLVSIFSKDVSGNMAKASFVVPAIYTGFQSGAYILESPIELPVAFIDNELAALNSRQCFATTYGNPLVESVYLSQSSGRYEPQGVTVSLHIQTSNFSPYMSLSGTFEPPFSNPLTFPSTSGSQSGGPFGYVNTYYSGSIQQIGPEELSFDVTVRCDYNGAIYEYQFSGSATLDTIE